MGTMEELIETNRRLISLSKEIIEEFNRIKQSDKLDTSWVTVEEICDNLKISQRDFHRNWKNRMSFLKRVNGPRSQFKARRFEFEQWKEDYWNSL